MNGCLGDTQQLSATLGLTRLGALGWFATEGFDLGVCFFEDLLCNDLALAEVAVTFVGDFDAVGETVVDGLEIKAIANQTRQHVSVASRIDFYFAKHASNNDLDVLVVDFYLLATIDLLDFVAQVFLNKLFT